MLYAIKPYSKGKKKMVIRDTTVAVRESKLAGISTKVDSATSMTHGYDSMLGQANMLGWDMETRPLVNVDGLAHKGKNEITRYNPKNGQREIMNGVVVGSNFVPIQLERAFSIGDYLIQLGAKPISAGTLQDGKLAFAILDLQKKIFVGGVDELASEFILLTGNAGQLSLKGNVNMTRRWCTNQIPAEQFNKSGTRLSIRHTASADYHIGQAKQILDVANSWVDEVEEIAEKLVNVPMQNDQFVELAKNIYPKPLVTDDVPNRRSVSRWSNMIDELESIFLGDGSQGDTTGQIGNTAWCGYNALTERIDWYRTSKADEVTGKDNSNLRSAQALGVIGQTGKEKSNILAQVQHFVDNLPQRSLAVS